MKKRVLNRHKAHKSPQWLVGALMSCALVQLRDSCHGPGAGRHRSRCRVLAAPGKSLNWGLRRYVLPSSLRVWLMRQEAAAGGSSVPPGRPSVGQHGVGHHSIGRHGVGQHGASRPSLNRRSPSASSAGGPGRSARFVDRYRASGAAARRDARIRRCGYCTHRNRQMEHLTQVAAGFRGGFLRGAAITPREWIVGRDLVLTTLSDITYVQSNIFGFVMT
jgi:hypothetical protein